MRNLVELRWHLWRFGHRWPAVNLIRAEFHGAGSIHSDIHCCSWICMGFFSLSQRHHRRHAAADPQCSASTASTRPIRRPPSANRASIFMVDFRPAARSARRFSRCGSEPQLTAQERAAAGLLERTGSSPRGRSGLSVGPHQPFPRRLGAEAREERALVAHCSNAQNPRRASNQFYLLHGFLGALEQISLSLDRGGAGRGPESPAAELRRQQRVNHEPGPARGRVNQALRAGPPEAKQDPLGPARVNTLLHVLCCRNRGYQGPGSISLETSPAAWMRL